MATRTTTKKVRARREAIIREEWTAFRADLIREGKDPLTYLLQVGMVTGEELIEFAANVFQRTATLLRKKDGEGAAA